MESLTRRSSRRRRTSQVPRNLQCADPGLSHYYYSRRHSRRISIKDLPDETDAVGIWSPWAVLWFCCFMVAPVAYIYIALMLLRDFCVYFPETVYGTLNTYVPWLARLADMMKTASRSMDVWCVIEALFYIGCKLKIQYLQGKDPLEASLSAAPMMDPEDRRLLWERIMETEKEDPVAFISGWFFDESIEQISRYDVYDFLCWSLFDGRNQEHLTTEELHDLESFLESLEYHISLQLNGVDEDESNLSTVNEGIETENNNPNEGDGMESPTKGRRRIETDEYTIHSDLTGSESMSLRRPRPKKIFRFSLDTHREEPTFYSNLYESYKERYERYRHMMEQADFHPVQDLRNMLVETKHQAEESAQSMYETIIQPGSSLEKHLSALSSATSAQLSEAWHSVQQMKERVETANFLSERRNALMEQLRGNRAMLTRMREMSYAVPSKQMAALLRRITECYDALETVEQRASGQFEKFIKATGNLADRGNSLFQRKEPQRYAKYSSDPLLGIVTYPLGFHLFVLGASEIPLRILLRNRGFERRCVGPVTYYHHPGSEVGANTKSKKKVPVVFVHGIGIGIIAYVQLIDHFLKTGRPILLPEIPYASGFRPWQGPNSVLSPAVVASTMTAMLATHGYSKATFCGHSYGTSWLSYVCKYAPSSVAAFLFLDPICFCLHYAMLTKNFVYVKPDPGTVSFMIRTDMIINWTIQRAFPWTWIALFIEQVHVPCTVFLSEKDALVPSKRVENYFRSNEISVCDADALNDSCPSESDDFNAFMFKGGIHGAFTEDPTLLPPIAEALDRLCLKVEKKLYS